MRGEVKKKRKQKEKKSGNQKRLRVKGKKVLDERETGKEG